MHAELQAVLAQQQKLSAEQQQGLKLLQLPAEALCAEAALWMEENPLLERVDPEGGIPGVYEAWPGGPRPEGDFQEDADTPAEETLRGMLREQLLLSELTEDVRDAVRDLIDEVDDDGFLNPTPEDLASIDPSRPATLWDEAIIALRSFDPAGIACAGPVEAVREQIARLARAGELTQDATEALAHLFGEHLQAFASLLQTSGPARADAARALGLSPDVLDEVLWALPLLDPHPGRPWADAAPTVLPEFFVECREGRWVALENPAASPRLRLASPSVSGGPAWTAALQEARQLIARIDMRRETLRRIFTLLVSRQQGFFTEGPSALTPLTQKDVAEILGLAESTVSRAMAGKYFQCRAGTFEWRRLLAQAAEGGCSTDAVRARILALIAAEDPTKPLSDAAIEEQLASEGIIVARRTIAKYREMEGIPSTRQRRRKS